MKAQPTLFRTMQVLVVVAALALGSVPALAVHDLDFELDGNTKQDTTNQDWQTMFNFSGNAVPVPKLSLPGNFGPAAFFRDFTPGSSADSTTFATGSKDTLNISTGWQCASSNNVNNKVDVNNAYAVAYINPSNQHVVVYFGLDTASNEGTRDAGFWFLKDKSVGCVSGKGATSFTGNHQDGDLLITAEYTGTSGVSSIQAFVWVGGANGALNTTPIATGVDCQGIGGPDPICATTNRSIIKAANIPWLVQTVLGKTSSPGVTTTDLDIGEFFEGGIDLTALGLSGCFTQFLADTRSSASPTATIFDYTLGSFPLCGISVGKACAASASNPHVLADGQTLETQFSVPISTQGPGALSTVTLAETPTLPAGATASCRITAVTTPSGATLDASVSALPVNFSGTTPITIYDSLPGNSTGTVTVVCDTTGVNPFINSVAVTAKSSSTLSSPDLGANHTVDVSKGEACSFSGNAAVTPQKCCVSVQVNPSNLQPQVCVKVTLTNSSTPAEDVVITKVTDSALGDLSSHFTTLQESGSGATQSWSQCYTPTSADQSGTTPLGTGSITFSDHLTEVAGHGAVSGSTFDLTTTAQGLPSATCPLCGPQGCPPQ
jgi:hypothetical protein